VAKNILSGNGKILAIGNPFPNAHLLTHKQREKKERIGTIAEIEK